ncbi:uncharacterized protein LOC123694076 [Colias croceus]|uniref:uncharacterized protein LOC123694076 n=1 Tax=Colias crocea TaxID=72248 RepID=UPI001E27E853|nr:uncharacterized protein LOC123694076 [Colias croceus]
MTESNNFKVPEPRKVGVWTEGVPIQSKEFVIPKKSPESLDDIPTLPDLDDLQDMFEKELSKPPASDRKDKETAYTLAEVGGGISGSVEGVEAALEVLKSYISPEESDSADTVWTIDSLLTQLAEECDES